MRVALRTTTRSAEPDTSRNGPGTKRGAAATVVSAYGKRRHEKGSRTSRRFAVGTATRTPAKSQRSGAPRRRSTRRSAAAIDGALRHVKVHVRNWSLAAQALQRPGATAPVAGSVRSGVAYSARASVVSSRPAASAGSSGQRRSVSATRTTFGGPLARATTARAAPPELQPAARAIAQPRAATSARGRARGSFRRRGSRRAP